MAGLGLRVIVAGLGCRVIVAEGARERTHLVSEDGGLSCQG